MKIKFYFIDLAIKKIYSILLRVHINRKANCANTFCTNYFYGYVCV